MKLEEITAALLHKAIRIYLDIAYDDSEERENHRPGLDLSDETTDQGLLANFVDESHYTEDELSHRHILRLGNSGYPHMKLVVEEFFVPGQYYIAVDTHDHLPVAPDNPEYKQWLELRAANTKIKDAIEKRWTEEELPTLHNVREAIRREVTTTAHPTRLRVLVVDDEPEMAETSKAMLQTEGYTVNVVNNGPDALEEARKDPPDIILLDIQMPGMDGYEVCKRLRNDPAAKHIPILLVTAAPGEMIYTMQADGFLCKPYNRRILRTFVQHVIRNRSHRDKTE